MSPWIFYGTVSPIEQWSLEKFWNKTFCIRIKISPAFTTSTKLIIWNVSHQYNYLTFAQNWTWYLSFPTGLQFNRLFMTASKRVIMVQTWETFFPVQPSTSQINKWPIRSQVQQSIWLSQSDIFIDYLHSVNLQQQIFIRNSRACNNECLLTWKTYNI